jgi:hypothetical protein
MPQVNELPDFDPAWDYATVYDRLNAATNRAIELLNFIAAQEESTKDTDILITAAIAVIGARLNTINGLMKQD